MASPCISSLLTVRRAIRFGRGELYYNPTNAGIQEREES